MSKENKVDNKVPRAPKNPQLGKVQGEQLKSCHQVSCLHHKQILICCLRQMPVAPKVISGTGLGRKSRRGAMLRAPSVLIIINAAIVWKNICSQYNGISKC